MPACLMHLNGEKLDRRPPEDAAKATVQIEHDYKVNRSSENGQRRVPAIHHVDDSRKPRAARLGDPHSHRAEPRRASISGARPSG